MRISHLLVVITGLTLSFGSLSYGQDAGPDGAQSRQPQRDRDSRPGRNQIDPSTDEVLQTIRAAVDPTDEQMEQIVARYRQFRREQREARREIMPQRRRGAQQSGDRESQQPRNREGRQPGNREGQQRGNRQGRQGMMQKLQEVMKPINAKFLADSRAMLNTEQQKAWDGCAAGLDLMPQMRGRGGGRGASDPSQGPKVGDKAPDFELIDLDNKKLSLKSLLGKPVVIEFGSYTCPVFRRKVEGLASLQSQYGEAVQWVMVYTLEAHPTDGWNISINTRSGIELPQHTSFEKRLECAKLCQEKLDLKLHVLVDGYENKVTDAYGGRPNRGFVIDAQGKVVSRQAWIEVDDTRKALDSILQRKDSKKSAP